MANKGILKQTDVDVLDEPAVLKCPSCKGLRLEATIAESTGRLRKIWTYRYRPRTGGLRQIKLGEYPFMTLNAAKAAYRAQKVIRDDPAQGDPRRVLWAKAQEERKAMADAKVKGYTVRQLCADYISEYLPTRRKNSTEPTRLLETDVVPKLGHMAAVEVRRLDVHTRIQAIIARGAPRIAQMVRTELRAAFEYAIDSGRLPDEHPNPVDRVKAPAQVRRNRALLDEELHLFLNWLPSAVKMSRTVKDALMLELLTSARQGEIVAMRWVDCDLTRGVWTQPTSKNKKRHEVMLSIQAMDIIKSRVGLHGKYVFPLPKECGGEGHVASKTVGIQQWAAKETLSIADWTPHDLRRSSLTGLARLGCPRVVQDRISNHVDRSMAAIYDVHDYNEEAKDWLQRWANKLDELRCDAKDNAKHVGRIRRIRPKLNVVHSTINIT